MRVNQNFSLRMLGLGLVLVSLWKPMRASALPSCTAARFPDYRDLGCQLRGQAFRNLPCPPCPPGTTRAVGMPRWQVSSPFQNVWVSDTPLSYPLSSGATFSFQWTHRQRYQVPEVYTFTHTGDGNPAFTNRDGQVTRYTRDTAGRLLAVTNANLEVTRVQLNSRGQVTNLFDGLNYQTRFSYDEYGLRRSRTDALNRTTYWNYNANGWLTNRVTPQFGNTFYSYDNVGNLTNIAYPASSIAYAFNALNQLTNMSDAVGVTKFTHTPTGQLQSEDGPWSDDTLTLSYTEGLRTALGVGSSWSQNYGYDAAWRMTSLASPAGSFDYGYASPVSPLVSRITLPNGSWITNDFDSLARLRDTSLKNRWGHTLDGTTYTHDPLGLRTNLLRDLGGTRSTVSLTYDPIAQLTTWNAQEIGGAPRHNEQLGWHYDGAGNLHHRTNGLLIQTFTTDDANQLSTITRSGPLTVTGNTPAPATNVTVNGNTAERYGDFTFARTNLTLSNPNNSFTIVAENAYGVAVTNAANSYLPTPISLSYDLNGNLISDGLRWFEYDPENQLTAVTLSNAWRTEFVYDGLGRRRITRDYGWQSGNWVKTNETRHVCDGLLPIQERDANNNVLVTYTRGLDFSGGLHGAGGIGGLLARTDASGSTFYHADGSGNITALMNSDGDIVARYLYHPFGKLVGNWGTLADANTMRFSSKEHHANSGLYYYGFRFYDPNLQRWQNQDPNGERSGINLFQTFANSPLNVIDPDGRDNMYNPGAGQNAPVNIGLSSPVGGGYVDSYALGTDPLVVLPAMGMMGTGELALNVAPSMIPLVGEYQDLSVLEDPNAAWWEKGLAGTSFGANVFGAGFFPNVGGILKAIKKPCKTGAMRTPAENRAARNHFKNNKDAAREAWEQRTGQKWPTDANGNPWPAEHTPPLKDFGDPMTVTPRDPGAPDPHNVPGPDGLTDYQRWGALGTAAREANK